MFDDIRAQNFKLTLQSIGAIRIEGIQVRRSHRGSGNFYIPNHAVTLIIQIVEHGKISSAPMKSCLFVRYRSACGESTDEPSMGIRSSNKNTTYIK
jgi:ATP sulfurylase